MRQGFHHGEKLGDLDMTTYSTLLEGIEVLLGDGLSSMRPERHTPHQAPDRYFF
jgi:hypothetical protein